MVSEQRESHAWLHKNWGTRWGEQMFLWPGLRALIASWHGFSLICWWYPLARLKCRVPLNPGNTGCVAHHFLWREMLILSGIPHYLVQQGWFEYSLIWDLKSSLRDDNIQVFLHYCYLEVIPEVKSPRYERQQQCFFSGQERAWSAVADPGLTWHYSTNQIYICQHPQQFALDAKPALLLWVWIPLGFTGIETWEWQLYLSNILQLEHRKCCWKSLNAY